MKNKIITYFVIVSGTLFVIWLCRELKLSETLGAIASLGAAFFALFKDQIIALFEAMVGGALSLKAKVDKNSQEIEWLKQSNASFDFDHLLEAMNLYEGFAERFKQNAVIVPLTEDECIKWKHDLEKMPFLLGVLKIRYK